MFTPESRALRHLFMAERAASKIPDVPEDTPKREIKSVAVIGAGTMGGGIAMNFLNAGIPVKILEMKQEALDRGIATIRKNYESQVKKGKLKQDKYDQRMALLSTTLDYDDLKDADLVIEAVFEEMGVKQKVFEKLDEVMKPGAILASNTSTLDVNKIASFTKRPQDVVGLHFFSPANVMKLLEVVRGAKTGKDVLATVMAHGQEDQEDGRGLGRVRRLHRQPHDRAVQPPGRLPAGRRRHAAAGGPRDREVRLRDGPVPHGRPGRQRHRLGDPQAPRRRSARTCCTAAPPTSCASWAASARRPARAGTTTRPASATPSRPTLVNKMIEDHRKELGITPRKISDEEIVQRLVFSLVNEGAHILEEGIASRASDIDMVYLTGYGFPIHRGGPMLYADQVGLFNVVQAMKRFQKNPRDDAKFWEPAPLLARLAAEGKTFN